MSTILGLYSTNIGSREGRHLPGHQKCGYPVLTMDGLSLINCPPLPNLSPLQVRYTQLVRQKKRKPGGRGGRGAHGGVAGLGGGALGRLGRAGSRRSGYAFAHQEGFGELITSGKNMRLSSLALATFASRHSASWIDTLRKKKQQPPQPGGEGSPASSYTAPLSTSSSMLGPPDTQAEEAANTPLGLAPSGSSSAVTPTPARSPGGESTGGWAVSLGAVQVTATASAPVSGLTSCISCLI